MVVGGILLTVVLVSNHRADVEAEERRESASAKAAAQAASDSAASVASVEARESEEAEALAAAQEAHASCLRLVGPLLDALSTVDARLDVGLSQDELSTLVGEASVAYNKITVDDLGDGNCLSAAAKMESAFNAYATTVRRWNDCIYDYYCDVDSIDPMLQRNWARANRLLTAAGELIDEMDPESPDYVEGAAGDIAA